MAYLTGLLGGFSARKSEVEAQNLEESRLAQAREARVYETLINSPDKETRDLAIAGLLESAQPRRRKGGLRGWLGELEQSPYLSQIQALSPDVEAEESTYGLPSRQTSGYIGTIAPQESSLAQAPTSPTEVGAPPPTPTTPMPSASITREVAAPVTGTRTVSRPRQVFRTPEDQTRLTRRAQAQGDVEGEVAGLIAAGYSDDEARELVRQNYARRGVGASPFQSIAGELPDGTPAFGVFDRVTGGYTDPITDRPIPGFRPRTTTGSVSLGQYAERAAGELGFRSAAAARAAGPQAMARVNQRATELQAEAGGATTTARGEAAASIPLSSSRRIEVMTGLQDDWRRVSQKARDMQTSVAQMKTALQAAQQGSIPPAAEAIIVLFERSIDPDSVVREAEARRPGTFSSLITRVQGTIDRLRMGGATIPVDQLVEYVQLADQMQQAAVQANGVQREIIGRTATESGIDPTLIFGGTSAAVGPPPAVTGATATPASAAGPVGIFNGPDGKLHQGSPTGPLLPGQE